MKEVFVDYSISACSPGHCTGVRIYLTECNKLPRTLFTHGSDHRGKDMVLFVNQRSLGFLSPFFKEFLGGKERSCKYQH